MKGYKFKFDPNEPKEEREARFKKQKEAQDWLNNHLECIGADGKEDNEIKKAIINKFLKGG